MYSTSTAQLHDRQDDIITSLRRLVKIVGLSIVVSSFTTTTVNKLEA